MKNRVDAAIENAVIELKESDAIIEQLRDEYMAIKVDNPQDDAGFKTATTALKRMVRLRNQVEKKRKELKADAVRYGKAVDGEARRLQTLIEPIEAHLKTQADIVRLEQKRLEVEAENKRREEVRGWIKMLNDIGAPVDPDALKMMKPADFEWHYRTAKSEADKRNAEREQLEKDRAEIAAAKAELEALRAEKAEREKKETIEEPVVKKPLTTAESPAEPINPTPMAIQDVVLQLQSIQVPDELKSSVPPIIRYAVNQVRRLAE